MYLFLTFIWIIIVFDILPPLVVSAIRRWKEAKHNDKRQDDRTTQN